MNAISQNPPARYLSLNKFHIVALVDVTPDAVKRAAKTAKKDREAIRLTTVQNAIVKRLGFVGGFAGFQQEFRVKLEPFMKKHSLLHRRDLIRPQSDMAIFSLTPRSVGERFFLSQLP